MSFKDHGQKMPQPIFYHLYPKVPIIFMCCCSGPKWGQRSLSALLEAFSGICVALHFEPGGRVEPLLGVIREQGEWLKIRKGAGSKENIIWEQGAQKFGKGSREQQKMGN